MEREIEIEICVLCSECDERERERVKMGRAKIEVWVVGWRVGAREKRERGR